MMSLGGTCAVTYNLRLLFSKNEIIKSPFDWAKISIKQLICVLEDNFNEYDKLEIKKFSENHPLLNDEDKDEKGSLILTNPYGITFAHQILEMYELDIYIIEIGKQIFNFMNLQSEITLVRFETGMMKSDFNTNLKKLLELLSNFFKFKLTLIVHKSYNNNKILKDERITFIYFNDFEADWKYPNIEWSLIKKMI